MSDSSTRWQVTSLGGPGQGPSESPGLFSDGWDFVLEKTSCFGVHDGGLGTDISQNQQPEDLENDHEGARERIPHDRI